MKTKTIRKITALILSLFILLVFVTACQSTGGVKKDNEAELDFTRWNDLAVGIFKNGESSYKENKFASALHNFEWVVKFEPEWAEAYILCGNADYVTNYTSGLLSYFLWDYDKAVAINSKYQDFARGARYYHEEDYLKAIECFDKAIRNKINTMFAYYLCGMAYFSIDEFEKSISSLTKAIRLNPDFAPSYVHRGLAYLVSGNIDKALPDFEFAIKLNPSDGFKYKHKVLAYQLRGTAYHMMGNFSFAIDDFSQMIQIDPDDFFGYYSRGQSYLEMRDYDNALADIEKALQINPEYAEAKTMRNEIQAGLRAKKAAQ